MTVSDEQSEAGWPSFGQLVWDLGKLSVESLGGIFFQFFPWNLRRRGLTPLKDSLIMPEDEPEPPPSLKQRAPIPLSEAHRVPGLLPGDGFSEVKPVRVRSSGLRDPALSTKHRSSRRQELAEFYGSGEAPQHGQVRPKSQKERTKHRPRENANFGVETRGGECKASGYENTKYGPYNFRNKYGDTYRFD